eukprot:Amastigsp_a842734_722.p1 type:complete len:102 gc:universal Amastigsp_a842734_722:40-345(+)
MLFCPICGNLLLFKSRQFSCSTCIYQTDAEYSEYLEPANKEMADILGDSQWKNAQTTTVVCKNETCESEEAFFKQVQTRSADEPMTTTYRCVRCRTVWVEQ